MSEASTRNGDTGEPPRTANERFDRVHAVFVAVCDLTDTSRRLALDRLCRGDDGLRSEVEALVDNDGEKGDALSELAVASGSLLAGTIRYGIADADAVLPAAIGGYRIVRKLGDGGMGTVYEAEQSSPQRRVALKTLHRWSHSAQHLRRFRAESQLLGRLQHTGIAQVHEARLHDPDDGSPPIPFFVMELIDGEPITAYLRSHRLCLSDRLRLFLRIASAVAYAHQRGVIHRDLKPDNILVDRGGQPKIIDFGIATSAGAPDIAATRHTSEGQLVGTLPYMSPEQVSGNPLLVDMRSDVYALGVILFEMLTGHLPHDLRHAALPDAIRTIREKDHTRLSSIDRSLRGDLDTILGKALEKDPDRRYQTVSELAGDVQRHLDHEPIAARQPSTFYQIAKFARRHRSLVGGMIGIVTVLLAGVAGTTAFWLEARSNYRAQRHATYLATIAAATAAFDRDDVPGARNQLDRAPPELRGWEWHFLDRSLQQWSLAIECDGELEGNPWFLDDDRAVAAVLRDGHVGVWDVRSGARLRDVALGSPVRVVADAGAGNLLAVATVTGEIIVVDLSTGAVIDRWSGIGDAVTALAMSPDGSALLLGDPTGIVAWSRADRDLLWTRGTTTLLPAGRRIESIVTGRDADGAWIAAASIATSSERCVYAVLDGATGASGELLRAPEASSPIALGPGGASLAVGAAVRDIILVDAAGVRDPRSLTGHTGKVGLVRYSPDGALLASRSGNGTIHVRTAADGRSFVTLHDSERRGQPMGLCFSRDGRRIASHAARQLLVWDLPPSSSLVLRGDFRYAYQVAFSPDSTLLASASFDRGETHLWDAGSGESLAVVGGARNATHLSFSSDGRHLSSRGERLVMLDVDTGETLLAERLPLEERPRRATRVVRSSTGAEATYSPQRSGDGDAVVQLRRRDSSATIASLRHAAKVHDACFSPDGQTLAVACDDGSIAVWDVATASRAATLAGHVSTAYCVAFNPDGSRLASGGNDGTLRLWDAGTWEQVFERHDHTSYVHDVAFSPDGTRIATASGDGTVRLWDSTPKPVRRREIDAESARRAALGPTLRQLIGEGTARESADRLRGDGSLDAESRRSALRLLLAESARRSGANDIDDVPLTAEGRVDEAETETQR